VWWWWGVVFFKAMKKKYVVDVRGGGTKDGEGRKKGMTGGMVEMRSQQQAL
jgi:hypothetical protein